MGLLLAILGLVLLLIGYQLIGIILIVAGILLLFIPGPFYGVSYWRGRRAPPP